jgi:YD repeat-containing protein
MRRKSVVAGFVLASFSCAFATASGASETKTYTYDALGRLVATTVTNGAATTIAYDPAGNRRSYTVSGAGAAGSGGSFLVDGSFESPPQNGGYAYNPIVSGVTFTGYAGVQGNGSAWGFADAPDGSQTGFLQSYGGTGGTIAFAVSGLTPGASYQAGFSIAQRPAWGAAATVTASFDGTALGSFTPASTAFAQVATARFTATAATGTLTLSVPGTAADSSVAVDKVAIVAVAPSPAVADASFESPSQNGAWAYRPAAAGATFGGNAGLAANGSAWGFADAPDGAQVAFLQGGSATASATITLAVSGLTPGASYRIVFSHARRPVTDTMWFNVWFNGTDVADVMSTSTAFTQVTSAPFTATATTGTITFTGVVTANPISAAVDNVTVVPAS